MRSLVKNKTMQSESFEFVSGKRCNSKLIYLTNEKQLYKKKSYYKGKTFYTCYASNCKARAEILEDGTCVKSQKIAHTNHLQQEEIYKELKAVEDIKKQCSNPSVLLSDTNAASGIRKVFKRVCER